MLIQYWDISVKDNNGFPSSSQDWDHICNQVPNMFPSI